MRMLPALITVGLFALAPDVAKADLISDEEANCRSQEVGAACKIGNEAGTCQKSTCARNDYSEGVPPKTKQVECMVCKAGAPEPEPVAEEKAPESADAKEEKPASKDETSKDPKDGAKDEASSKSGGCSVGAPAPLGLGLFLLGGMFWSRRRS